MRYLTTYKIFESLNRPVDLVSTLEDIAWDIKDEGYDIKITNLSQPIAPLSQKFPRIQVIISGKVVDGKREHIDISKISEGIRRMCRFMESEGYRHWVFPGLASTSHFVKANDIGDAIKAFPLNKTFKVEVKFKR